MFVATDAQLIEIDRYDLTEISLVQRIVAVKPVAGISYYKHTLGLPTYHNYQL